MSEIFKVATITHKNAPLAIREKLVLDQEQTMTFYTSLKAHLKISESFILSTCNRTEIYYRSKKTLTQEIVKLLSSEKNIAFEEVMPFFKEIKDEKETINYFFEVSIGVHSQIVGDQQIINQVKIAYQWAADAEMAGAFLHKVLHTIFIANKRVVQETGFRDGAASTTFVTLDLLASFATSSKNPTILVLGLGEIGSDIAKSLKETKYTKVSLCNRTISKAQELATSLDFEVLEYENLHENLSKFNVVISSVRMPEHVISDETSLSKNNLTYLFDLSLPRSISPVLEQTKGVVLFTLDEIQKRKDQGILTREAEIPAVKKILEQLVDMLEQSLRELSVTPTIHKLKGVLEQIKSEEIARYSKNISEKEKDLLEKVSNSIIQKILKQPVLNLKDASINGDPDTYILTLNKLFDLEK